MSGPELAAIITAASGFAVAVFGVIISALTNRSAASKAELESLRSTIETLQKENERLRNRLNDLECDRAKLEIRVEELEKENRQLREKTRPRKTDTGG